MRQNHFEYFFSFTLFYYFILFQLQLQLQLQVPFDIVIVDEVLQKAFDKFLSCLYSTNMLVFEKQNQAKRKQKLTTTTN